MMVSYVIINGQNSHKISKYRQISLTIETKAIIYSFRRQQGVKTNSNIEEAFIMNKTELVDAMAKNAGLSKKDAEKALKAFTETVAKELKKGGKVQLVGFGTFEVSKRAAREGRNPQTGAVMKIKASKAPKFKAGKALKDLVNK